MTPRPLPPGVRRKGIGFEARWHDGAGKRHSATFDTAAEADAYRQEQLRARRRGGSGDPSGGKVLLKDWFATWMRTRVVRDSTRERDDGYARNHLLPDLGDRRLVDLRPVVIAEWRAGLLAGGLAPATVAKHLTILSSCLKAALANGLIDANPAEHVGSVPVPQVERRFLTPDELAAIEAEMPPRWALVVPFLADSGLRIGELAALQVRDLDLLRATVSVTKTAVGVTKAVSKTGARRQVHEPKTRAGHRVVPTLTPSTCERLAQHIAERCLGPDDWLFGGGSGPPLDANNWRGRVWRPAVKRAGLADPQPTPHALRHTAVALWIAAGVVEPLELSSYAGHSSVQVTYSVYGHLLPHDAEPVRAALEAMRQAAKAPGSSLAPRW